LAVEEDLRIVDRPALRRPVLISAFRGWNDGGQAATVAAAYLARQWDATRFADIDPESFMDFQAVRPTVTLDGGLTRRIEWPENVFFHAPVPGADRDAVILLGVEPNYRWRAFTDLVVGLARDLGVELVVTLGALLADVPHTRPAPVTGAATDPRLVEELGLQLSRYEGPTGIVGVLHDACRSADLRSVSLWSAVPHYVSLAPSPRAAKALCVRLSDLMGVPIPTVELDEAEEEYAAQVSEAVASDPETQAYVEELEQRADSLESFADEGQLPTGEALADELTRFLRDRDRDRGRDVPPDAYASGVSTGSGASVGAGVSVVPADSGCCAAPGVPSAPVSAERRLRRRLRDLRAGAFGAGRLSASAVAVSWIGPSASRARSRSWFARGV
jgi:proteasome assembly chaperone (PAC2) family protein